MLGLNRKFTEKLAHQGDRRSRKDARRHNCQLRASHVEGDDATARTECPSRQDEKARAAEVDRIKVRAGLEKSGGHLTQIGVVADVAAIWEKDRSYQRGKLCSETTDKVPRTS